MASVTKETDNWNVDISPGEEITLTMAQTYVDRDINVKAAAAPTPGDGKLTIQKNGVDIATFTANQSGNTTANIPVADGILYANGTGTAAKTTSPYNYSKWEAAIPSITELSDGLTIAYQVPVAGNGTYGTCLQVNNLGYHPVVRGTNTMISTRYGVDSTILLTYNSNITGTVYADSASSSTIKGCWVCVNDIDNNDTSVAYNIYDYNLRPYAAQAVYRYKICGLNADNEVVPLVTTNQSNTTLVAKQTTQIPFRGSTGLFYYNSTTTINANSVMGGRTLYRTFNVVPQYTFNGTVGSTSCLGAYKAVYIKGSYDKTSDMFTLVDSTSTDWFVQVPTNTNNIKYTDYFTNDYYMLVGYTYSSADALSLISDNVIYYFDGTNLTPVTNIGSENIPLEFETDGDGTIILKGNCEYDDRLIAELKMLGWTVPLECPVQNTIEGNVFTQNVGRIDLGSLEWRGLLFGDANNIFIADIPNAYFIEGNELYTNRFVVDNTTIPCDNSIKGKSNSNGIEITCNSYASNTTFKAAMDGVYLYYQLATPITKIIDGNEISTALISAEMKVLGWNVPRECRIQNEINNNLLLCKVGRIDLSLLNWIKTSSGNRFEAQLPSSYAKAVSSDTVANVYLYGYSADSYTSIASQSGDKKVGFYTDGVYVEILDKTYNDSASFRNAMQGRYLYYELANPIALSIDGNELSNKMTDLKMLGWTVPKECPIQNTVNGNQFIQRVGRVDLGSLSWVGKTWFSSSVPGIKLQQGTTKNPANIYCTRYTPILWSQIGNANYDKRIGVSYADTTIGITDTSFSDSSSLKNSLSGVYLYYELATPITKTIDGNEVSAKDKTLKVVAGKFVFPEASTTGVQGLFVTFPKSLPNVPISITLTWNDTSSTIQDGYVKYLNVLSGSETSSGFTAQTYRIKTGYRWQASYAAFYYE